MIHYAGQNLLVEDPDGRVAAFLDRHLAPRLGTIFGQPSLGRSDGSPVPREDWPEEPPFRVNTLYWPATGATRWAYGLFLADYDGKTAIQQALAGGEGRVTEYNDALLQLSEGDYESSLFSADQTGGFRLDEFGRVLLGARMHLLPPRPVSYVDGKDLETLWLLPLVDQRYFWRDKPVHDTFAPTTWAGALTDLATALGVEEIAGDAIETDLGSVEFTGIVRPHANAAELLDWLAAMTGRRVVCHPDGTVRLENVADAIEALEENVTNQAGGEQWTRIAGGDFTNESNGAVFPETVRIVFAETDGSEAGTADVAYSDLLDDGPEYDAEQPPLPAGPPRVGEVALVTVPDGMLDAPDQAAYDAAALILARALWGWRTKRYDLAFAAIKQWAPTGFDDWIEWSVAARFGGSLCGQSRVSTLPVGFGMRTVAIVEPEPDGFGKLDQAVTAGVQTGSETLSVWKGPAFGGDDADTGKDHDIDYVTDSMDSTTYVYWWFERGKCYVTPWECPA